MQNSLPIVQRELLVGSRKRLTFASRLVAAVGGFAAVFLVLGVEPDFIRAGALGARLFHTLTWPAFAVCLFGGALLTADCLSVEKREGTLGLLFLTDLKGYDVVLGKFVAKSLTAVFVLLAIVPMLAIPILLGGVTMGDFWRIVLVLLNTTFVSLSIGMWTSVRCRDTRNVFAVASFLVFLLVIVPQIAHVLLPARWRFIAAGLSPVFVFTSAMPGRLGPVPNIPWPLFLQHLLGWACLLSASLRVQTSWQERPVRPARRRWREILRGSAAARLALRRELLPVNPVLWLESRDWLLRFVLTGIVLCIAIGCWFINNTQTAGGFHWSDVRYSVITVFLQHFILTLLFTFDAGSRLVAARRDGALTMVLASRLDVPEILRGEFLALRRLFAWPLLVVLGFDAIWMACVYFGIAREPYQIVPAVVIAVCLPLVLIANCWGITWTAFYYGLRAKHPHRAALRAFAAIVGIPVMLFGLIASSGVLSDFLFGVLVFTGLNLVIAAVFGEGDYSRLKNEFRQSLTEHIPAEQKNFDDDYALLK